MELTSYTDTVAFSALARPCYQRDPVRHSGALTALRSVERKRTAELLATLTSSGRLGGVIVKDTSFPAVLSGVPTEAIAPAAGALADSGVWLDEVKAPRAEAEAFTRIFSPRTGTSAHVCGSRWLYQLTTLTEPFPVPGEFRMATQQDVELLSGWWIEFLTESMPSVPRESDPAGAVVRLLTEGSVFGIWCVSEEPVAMAMARLPEASMSRIGYVYTPPNVRGHGYGSAVTTAMSRWLRSVGTRHVVLYADTANPVANRIYQRMGYRRVLEEIDVAFTPHGDRTLGT